MGAPDVAFPNLGIRFQNIDNVAFTLPFLGWDVMWYGLLIGAGVILGVSFYLTQAKRNGLTVSLLMDYIVIAVPVSLIFTRLYYVLFNLDSFRGNWLGIITDIRMGGMGVYGGILAAFASLYIYARYRAKKEKKWSIAELMGRMGDCGALGLLIGQIIGRIGNLVNMEAFGGYTDGLFAMQLKLSNISRIYGHRSLEYLQSIPEEGVRGNVTYEMLQNAFYYDGFRDVVVLVHPTFLYEMMLNTGIFIFLMIYHRFKKFHGELLIWYALLYAVGRFFIESLRTDQLFLWNTDIPASMVVSVLVFAAAAALMVRARVRAARGAKNA